MRFNRNVVRTEMPPMVELARRAAELAAGGVDVIRLDQGAVDIGPPPAFVDRVTEVMTDPQAHRYAPDPGLIELREALGVYGRDRFGVDWDPEREMVVTAGANQACFAALLAVLEPGDEVLLPLPWYFNHAMAVTALGAVPVPVPTRIEEGHVPTAEAVSSAVTSRTRALVLINPNNPTGAAYGDVAIRELTELAIGKDLWLLSDQTYHEVYFGAAPSLSPAAVAGARDRIITVSSFSKSFGLAGWRLGFLAGHHSLIEEVLKIQDCSVICAGRTGQEGLAAALADADRHLAGLRNTLRERRDALVDSLRIAGCDDFIEPCGSLFLWLRVPGVEDGLALCHGLLEDRHVAAVPGRAFGPGAEDGIRLSFGSTSCDRLREAVRRIAAYVESLAGGP